MKIVIVFGLFVLVACMHYQANGTRYDGITEDCSKLPEGLDVKQCHSYKCNPKTGVFKIQECSLIDVACYPGQIPDITEDLSKPYPDCCPKGICRNP